MALLLFIFAVVFLLAAIIVAYYMDSPPLIFGCGVVAILCFTGAFVTAMSQSADECAQRGGTQVPDGAPIYIRSGDVMIPMQTYRCEVP